MKQWLTRLLVLSVLLVAIVIVVAATLPAATAYRYFEARLQPLRLQGIEGSIWNGRAAQASVEGMPIGALNWQIEPWSLFGLHMRGRAELRGSLLNAETQFDAQSEHVDLAAAKAELQANLLGFALDIPSLVLLGDVKLDVDALQLRDGVVQSMTGRLIWQDAGVAGSANARFSDVAVQFTSPRAGLIEGKVADQGGALKVDGEVRVEGERFTAEIRLGVRGEDPKLAEALLFIGERTSDGGSLLRVEGTMHKVFQ